MISTDPKPATAVRLTLEELHLLHRALGTYTTAIDNRSPSQLLVAFFQSLDDTALRKQIRTKLSRALAAELRRLQATGEAASSTAELS